MASPGRNYILHSSPCLKLGNGATFHQLPFDLSHDRGIRYSVPDFEALGGRLGSIKHGDFHFTTLALLT
jgi:hypothetical protein